MGIRSGKKVGTRFKKDYRLGEPYHSEGSEKVYHSDLKKKRKNRQSQSAWDKI